MKIARDHVLNKDIFLNYKVPEPLLHALVGLLPPSNSIPGVKSRVALLRDDVVPFEGFHSANQVFMYFRDSACTWAIVESTLAALVPRSEQW